MILFSRVKEHIPFLEAQNLYLCLTIPNYNNALLKPVRLFHLVVNDIVV